MTRYDSDATPDSDARSGIAENEHGTTITPIEAVIAEGDTRKLHQQAELSAQIIEERTKRAREPVRMEGLKPLPPELRGKVPGRGVIPGGADALDLAPSMRRSIPKPFSRERISVDHHGKTWAYMAAHQVREGDIVVEFGKIAEATTFLVREKIADVVGDPAHMLRMDEDSVATGLGMMLVNIAGETRQVDMNEQLRVFRVHGEEKTP